LLLFLFVTTEEPPLLWKYEPGSLQFMLHQQGNCLNSGCITGDVWSRMHGASFLLPNPLCRIAH